MIGKSDCFCLVLHTQVVRFRIVLQVEHRLIIIALDYHCWIGKTTKKKTKKTLDVSERILKSNEKNRKSDLLYYYYSLIFLMETKDTIILILRVNNL